MPGHVATYAGDVRDAAALARAGADFIARFGVPDIVIGNAGVSRGTLTDEAADMPAFRAVFETNVLGLVHTFQPFLAAMTARAPRHARRRGERRRLSRIAGLRRLFRVQGRGDHVSRKPARRTARHGRRRRDDLSGIHRHADDARNPYRMPFLLAPDNAARLIARAIARQAALLRAAMADGVGGPRAANTAAAALRFRVRAHRAQAAATFLTDAVPPDWAGTVHPRAEGNPRIACLVPSLTELLFALGLGECVVARTGFCVHPRGS